MKRERESSVVLSCLFVCLCEREKNSSDLLLCFS